MRARLFICGHAWQRCVEMGVGRAELVEAVTDPELTYPSPAEYGPQRQVSVRGRVAVVHDLDRTFAITVLWAGRSARHEGPLAA